MNVFRPMLRATVFTATVFGTLIVGADDGTPRKLDPRVLFSRFAGLMQREPANAELPIPALETPVQLTGRIEPIAPEVPSVVAISSENVDVRWGHSLQYAGAEQPQPRLAPPPLPGQPRNESAPPPPPEDFHASQRPFPVPGAVDATPLVPSWNPPTPPAAGQTGCGCPGRF